MITEKINCSKCQNSLGRLKLPEEYDFDGKKRVCIWCEEYHIFSNEHAMDMYKKRINDFEKLLILCFRQQNSSRIFGTLMSLREVNTNLKVGSISTKPQPIQNGLMGDLQNFVVFEIILRLFLKSERQRIEKCIEKCNNSNSEDIAEYSMIIMRAYQFLDLLKSNNGVLVKKNGDYYECEFLKYHYLNKTYRYFGVGKVMDDSDVEELLSHSKEIFDIEGLNNHYFLLLQIFTTLYSLLPSEYFKYYIFNDMTPGEIKILHHVVQGFFEFAERQDLGCNENDLKNNKLFHGSISSQEFYSQYEKIMEKWPPYNNPNYFQLRTNKKQLNDNFFHNIIMKFVGNHNNHSKPLIFIQNLFDYKIYYGCTSLLMFKSLLEIKIYYDDIKKHFEKFFDIHFTNKLIKTIKLKKFKYHDDSNSPIELLGIKNRKSGGFETDIIAYNEDTIFIIELKAFHPHINMEYQASVKRRDNRLIYFEEQYNKNNGIKLWIKKNFSKKRKNEINARKMSLESKKCQKVVLKFPADFNPKYIVPIYINYQYEIPQKNNSKINVICYDDIEEFFDCPEKWKRDRITD